MTGYLRSSHRADKMVTEIEMLFPLEHLSFFPSALPLSSLFSSPWRFSGEVLKATVALMGCTSTMEESNLPKKTAGAALRGLVRRG